jgi:hypothetical protein
MTFTWRCPTRSEPCQGVPGAGRLAVLNYNSPIEFELIHSVKKAA